MPVFRLCKAQYSATVLSGEGGLIVDGRWHSAGQRIVYCASSEALAVLEVRVHVGRFIPKAAYTMHVIEVADELIRTATLKQLPKDWSAIPHERGGQRYGDAWLSAGDALALRVPSVHSRTDFNVLLNPAHPSLSRVKVVDTYPYNFDRRLF